MKLKIHCLYDGRLVHLRWTYSRQALYLTEQRFTRRAHLNGGAAVPPGPQADPGSALSSHFINSSNHQFVYSRGKKCSLGTPTHNGWVHPSKPIGHNKRSLLSARVKSPRINLWWRFQLNGMSLTMLVLVALLDLSKACDAVGHQTLFNDILELYVKISVRRWTLNKVGYFHQLFPTQCSNAKILKSIAGANLWCDNETIKVPYKSIAQYVTNYDAPFGACRYCCDLLWEWDLNYYLLHFFLAISSMV